MVNEYTGPPAQELETFLPKDVKNGTSKYKITPAKTDVETASGSFDPFKERNCEHPTTDGETLTHLLKASLGTGILAMPIAFSYAGLVGGILATVLTALICTHCAYVLVKCAHTLYHRTKSTAMTFAEVAEVALDNGPQWGRGWGKFVSKCITYGLFVTYFGTCAVYTVIIATNFQQVIEHYTGTEMNLRMTIALLLVPLILLSWIPNLKYLAPVSMIANVFMCVGLGITFYYLVTDMPPLTERPLFISVLNWPSFFAIVIFAMEAIGVVMPLENQMKTPQNFIGICGVLNQGMAGVTLIYIFLGFLGYVRYGDQALGSITLNLPVEEIPAQAVKILIALAVYCTFGLQFYVCLDIVWIGIRNKFRKRPTLVNYTMRTVLVTAAVLLAVAVPTIGPFIGLIGAFCFSILGLLIPILIEMVTYWDQGFGKFNWIIWKNVLVSIFGIIALVFGSKTSIEDIIKLYTN
ncbi:proton-coupled amino acid transporter-like protein pathetic isoform X1 [Toxorhynchites rutilus septentrionalis]|uniref:proton-coupled amino acid transporter-like protein pathetic isoform X1 n=1 Tax=Toxorhynchites rutilus septentrionalis TaxID=329112 RepID=UPI0024785A06|nr:proton-coupled amino acid transporter-like protein pathetic isoform X1 [Toxorhynchites rutilus septentrionalis]XP_055621303.1 proton-coupled amino acid transporter-like protein pathetic isoform X1 [Toxorhynchites rutilus septentrionalis]XP_055621304.1 proton-coupled amino acid transporter-like protein pathetic isoform X1 [Toxorhynchites rutilus septentrionalis]XP_055621305.1 proton-coupled amino acid transporter-like protein pathetic isoform X1 [Toxorhynchites rutilus septentrionalis]XP_0556